jgi:hypothetical protein
MVQRQPASDQEPEKGNFGATRLTTEEECGLRWHSNSGHEEETQAAAAQRSANPSTKNREKTELGRRRLREKSKISREARLGAKP